MARLCFQSDWSIYGVSKMSTKTISKEEVLSLFEYKDGSLYWKSNRSGVRKNRLAGSKLKNGYVHVSVNTVFFYVHRLVFLIHHGFIPERIDHINGIRDDNRIENLRAATQSQNLWNMKMRGSNTSGVKGVHFCKKKKKWIAKFNMYYKTYYAGEFHTIKEAEAAVIKKREELQKEFARHE